MAVREPSAFVGTRGDRRTRPREAHRGRRCSPNDGDVREGFLHYPEQRPLRARDRRPNLAGTSMTTFTPVRCEKLPPYQRSASTRPAVVEEARIQQAGERAGLLDRLLRQAQAPVEASEVFQSSRVPSPSP